MGLPINVHVGLYRDSRTGRNIQVFRVTPLHIGGGITRGTVEYYYVDDPDHKVVTQYHEFAESHQFIPYVAQSAVASDAQSPQGSGESDAGDASDAGTAPDGSDELTQLGDPEAVTDVKISTASRKRR